MRKLPIRLRLTAWYFAVLGVVLSLFGLSAYLEMRHSINRTIDEELEIRAEGVHQLIERTFQRGGLTQLADGLKEHTELRAGGALLQVSDAQGNWIYRSNVMNDYGVPRPVVIPSKATNFLGKGLPLQDNGLEDDLPPERAAKYVAKDVPLRVWSELVQVGGRTYVIQTAAEMDDFYEALDHFALLLFVSIPLLLLCAAAGGYWISSRALAPVDQIASTARSISAQNLSSRLAVPHSGDELSRLSQTLNGMLERLEGAFRKITQFTADASHELRTPIAVMRTRAELSLRKARSAEEYRDTIDEIHSELEKTSGLIEQLMFLARADSGAETLSFAPVDIGEVLAEACQQGSALAEAKQITLEEQIPIKAAVVQGDASSLRRLFLILIDNAVKYTPAGGAVQAALRETGGLAVIEVRDNGIGISAADLPSVFERFYRADKARTRESGGVGLGLSIGRWIVEAHSGAIEVESTPGVGSTFRVRLPLMNGDTAHSGSVPIATAASAPLS